jgi:hypothetical protein
VFDDFTMGVVRKEYPLTPSRRVAAELDKKAVSDTARTSDTTSLTQA